jgi:hypothetical protein
MQGPCGRRRKAAAVAPLTQGRTTPQLPAQMAWQQWSGGLAGMGDQPTPCTLSLNILPAVKAGTRLASILIFSPVLGFRP